MDTGTSVGARGGGPSTTAEHPVSGLKSSLCSGVNVTASVLHVHRWLKVEVDPHELHRGNSSLSGNTSKNTKAYLFYRSVAAVRPWIRSLIYTVNEKKQR